MNLYDDFRPGESPAEWALRVTRDSMGSEKPNEKRTEKAPTHEERTSARVLYNISTYKNKLGLYS